MADCINGNCQNGIGTYVDDDGQYVGEWKDGKMHGQGTYTAVYGNKYVGEWEEGMRQGEGKLFDDKGDLIKEGYWRNGMYRGKKSTN